jgi:hypothetical protein
MMSTTSRIASTITLSLLLSLIAGASGAMVLWDQSVFDPNGPGIANSHSPGFNGFVIHSVNDVTVDATWNVQSITQYYSSWNFNWGSISTGYLHIAPKTGALPTFNPTTDVQVPMTATLVDGVFVVSATGLNIDLAAGEYWMGITPVAPAGISGANLQWAAPIVGDAIASHENGAWHNYYAGYDGAILVEGERPVSVDSSTWGSIKSLYR